MGKVFLPLIIPSFKGNGNKTPKYYVYVLFKGFEPFLVVSEKVFKLAAFKEIQ